MKCKEGKTYPCGKGCRAIGKPCGKNPNPPPPGTVTSTGRKCKPGVTRVCGKSCRSVCKPCKKDNTPGIPCDDGQPRRQVRRRRRVVDEFDAELGYQRAMRALEPDEEALLRAATGTSSSYSSRRTGAI
jgi:hypothetical protein